jgi:hypothetical protein
MNIENNSYKSKIYFLIEIFIKEGLIIYTYCFQCHGALLLLVLFIEHDLISIHYY